MNRTGRKSLDRMGRDPRVEEIWIEYDGCFGSKPSYWVSLTDGWLWEECVTLHEPTIKRLYGALSQVYRRQTLREAFLKGGE